MAHVLARLSGFGALLTPHSEYRVDRVDGEPDTVLNLARAGASGVIDVESVARGDAISDLVTLSEGRPEREWRIETSVCTCAWPRGFALSHDPEAMSPFLLLGRDGAMIWIAGPLSRERARPIEKLVAPDQTIRAVAEGDHGERVDLDYDVDGVPWWQRRYVIDWGEDSVIVVSAQAPREDEASVRDAVDEVERSIAPYRPD